MPKTIKKFRTDSQTVHFIRTAKALAILQGMKVAASYLQHRGFSFNAAHWILLGFMPRK
jgi:hypothetical protein